jgi:hypothetical protein
MGTTPKRRVAIQRTILATVTLVTLVGGTIFVTNVQANASASLTASVSQKQKEVKAITAASTERLSLITAVNAQIAASDGKVLDPAIIEAAKSQTAKSTAAVSEASKVAVRAKKNLSDHAAASEFAFARTIADNSAAISSIRLKPTLEALTKSDDELKATIASLQSGVHDWTVEQARIAAEKKAAEEKAAADAAAAAAAAAQAQARAASRSTAAASPRAPAAAVAGSSKMEIAQSVFARFGFSAVDYNSSLGASHYAATDMDNQIIYVHLGNIPVSRVESTCIHEYMHILQARQYGGYDGTVANFGSVLGMERAADRAALANGATWAGYL